MRISWNSLKVSIAGAKLTHLVQKDAIWDHGSMVEQVKNIFYMVERAKNINDPQPAKKYLSERAFAQLMNMLRASTSNAVHKNATLTEVSIIEVTVGKHQAPDRFTALIKAKRKSSEIEDQKTFLRKKNFGIENFSERWRFCRKGDWWLLDEIK